MQALQTFNFNNQAIKVQNTDGQVWFCGADVARAIGYKNGIQAIIKNVSSKHIREVSLRVKGRKPFFISKVGLYELIVKSELLSLETFQYWLYKQVFDRAPLTIETFINFLLELENSDSPKQIFKANDIVIVDFGRSQHKAIVLDFLQNILICIKFLGSNKIAIIVPSQVSLAEVSR